jgi:hypothetical protein
VGSNFQDHVLVRQHLGVRTRHSRAHNNGGEVTAFWKATPASTRPTSRQLQLSFPSSPRERALRTPAASWSLCAGLVRRGATTDSAQRPDPLDPVQIDANTARWIRLISKTLDQGGMSSRARSVIPDGAAA